MKKDRLIAAVLCLIVLAGCTPGAVPSPGSDSVGVSVYYIENSGLSGAQSVLNHETAYLEINDTESAVNALFVYLRAPGDPQNKTALPDSVKISGHSLENGIMTVNFSSSLLALSSNERTMLAAAITLTMLQLPGISYIRFLCEGQKTEQFGDSFYTAESFMLRENIEAIDVMPLTIYYISGGTRLAAEPMSATSSTQTTTPPALIYLLMQKPVSAVLTSPFEGKASLSGFNVESGVCSVQLKVPIGVEMSILDIYSVVNTLCENLDIEGVRILINDQLPSFWKIEQCDGLLTTNTTLLLYS